MADEKVGGIYYTVEARTAALLTAQQDVDTSTAKMQNSFDKTDKSVGNLNTGITKLAGVIKSFIAASVLREIAGLVQGYQEMAERVQMATASQAEFEMVQRRLLDTANGTYRSLGEAQTLYIQTADSLRSMNYTTSEAIDIQDSMSYAFVKNATSADRAQSAINAFTNSMNTGKVSADAWQSIIAATPSIINDVAKASGETAADIRALGAAGSLTARQLSEGLRKSLDENSAAAAGMSNNLTDASVRIKTAVTSIVVAFEGDTGVIQSFTNGIIAAADEMLSFSQSADGMAAALDTSKSVALIFASVIGGRYLTSLASATGAQIKKASASRAAAVAERSEALAAKLAATAALTATSATNQTAIANLRMAESTYAAAKGTSTEVAALSALSVAQARAAAAALEFTAAETLASAATIRLTAASRAASVGLNLLKSGFSLLGGPAGIILLAAGALYSWYQNVEEATQASLDLADNLGALTEKMQEMNRVQVQGTIVDLNKSIDAQKEAIADERQELASLQLQLKHATGDYINLNDGMMGVNNTSRKTTELQNQISQKLRDLDVAETKLTATQNTLSQAQGIYNDKVAASDALLKIFEQHLSQAIPNASAAAIQAMAITAQFMDEINKKAQPAKAPEIAEPDISGAAKDALKLAQQRLALSKLEGEQKAKLTAQYDAEKDGVDLTTEAGKKYVEMLGQTYWQTEQNTAATKKSSTATDSITSKLSSLKQKSQLTADSTSDLSREQAILNAQLSLGKGATAAQTKQAGEYAAKIWDTTNALKGLAVAEKLLAETGEQKQFKQESDALTAALSQQLITQEQYNQASERSAQTHQANLAKIRAENASGVTPQQELAGSVDPVQQAANEYAKKLALLTSYEQAAVLTHTQAVAQKNAVETQYEQQRLAALEQQYRAQSDLNNFTMSMIDTVGQRFGNMITGMITSTQSATEAARNLAATILNQAVGALVAMGAQALKNLAIGQTASSASVAQAAVTGPAIASAYAPAAAAVSLASYGANSAPAMAGIAATNAMSKMMAVGGRRYGGGVSAGNMYRVNESGESEVFQNSAGQQMFIPGQSGKVVPSDSSGGSSPVNIIINNTAPGATVENQGYNPDTKTITLAVKEVAKQLRSRNGEVARSLSDSWNISGKTR
ncbi:MULTISPECIES: tape measure protein [Enterobacterales]|uniref:tape measure protein n=1 Tax=Enterobacterales TaxID=91347 RepID=UPI002ED94208